MPALRNLRRSRRLSNKPPRDTVFEDFDDFHLHDDRQSTPSRKPISPEPDAGRARKDCKEPCTPQGGAPLPETDFEFVRRSSHSRKRDPDHIPRPPNAFMLFRSDFWAKEKNKITVERDHRMISRIAGLEWNKLSEAQRAPYRGMAERAKQQHAQLYPNYKYTPVFKKEKPVPRRKGARRYTGVARASEEDYEGDTLADWPKSEENEDDPPVRTPRPRKPASRVWARKSHAASRLPTPETRSPSPVSSMSEDDHIKSEPSTPELTFSPEPAKMEIDDSPYLPSRGLSQTMEGAHADPQVMPWPIADLSSSSKRWDDDPPSILNFSYAPDGESFISDPFSDAVVPVNVAGFGSGYLGSSEAVDDAFAISPIFNPDRAFSFTDPDSPLCDSHSSLGGIEGEGNIDFATWLREEA